MPVSIFYRAFKFQYPALINHIAVRNRADKHRSAFLSEYVNRAVFIAVFAVVVKLRGIGSAVIIIYPYVLRIDTKRFRYVDKFPFRIAELGKGLQCERTQPFDT